MEVVNGFFSRRQWVINSKGKRVTYKSFDYLFLHESKLVYTVTKHYGDVIWVFRKDTEELIYHGIATNRCDNLFGKYFALRICKDKKTLIVDENYNIRYAPYISYFDAGQGLAIICDNETYSYIKDDFSLAINEKYSYASPFNIYGFAIVETLDKVRQVIDIHGNVVIDNANDVNYFLNERFIQTYQEDDGYGIIDIKGNRILPNFYSSISVLNENYFLIEKNGKQGIADLTGKILLEPIYDEIMETQDKYVVRDFSKIEIDKTQSVNK